MNWLLSFFHLTVNYANVLVDNAVFLCSIMGIPLRPLTDFDTLDEQPEQLGVQLIDGGEPLCLFDEEIYFGGGGLQFLRPSLFRRECFFQILLLRIVIGREHTELFVGDAPQDIVLRERLSRVNLQ